MPCEVSGGGGGGPESATAVTGSGSPKDSMEAVFSEGASGAGGTPDALLTGVCTSPAYNSIARALTDREALGKALALLHCMPGPLHLHT